MSDLPKPNLDGSTKKKMDAIAEKHQSQIDKFKDLARELETDESEEAFDDKLRRVVKAPLTEADHKRKPGGHPVKNNRPEDQ